MKSSINVRYNVYAPKAEQNSLTHLNRAARQLTLIRADKRSVWRDSNESCCFVPLFLFFFFLELTRADAFTRG